MSTAAEFGVALARHIGTPEAGADAETVRLLKALLAVEGRTALDALAFVSIAENLVAILAALPAETTIYEVISPVTTIAQLLSRGVATLETLTGYAADGFSGETRTTN